jgi:hypothetical protein
MVRDLQKDFVTFRRKDLQNSQRARLPERRNSISPRAPAIHCNAFLVLYASICFAKKREFS